MRALIDRKDAPVNLRIEAINSLNSDRATQEDVKYLKDLYARAESDAMKRAVIDAVGRMDPATANPLLYQLAGRFDLFTIWVTILLAVGVAVLGKVSKGRATIFGLLIWFVGGLYAFRTAYLQM